MSEIANTDHPIHEPLARRWSPVCFDPRPIRAVDLCSLFEAARWAASSFNEQPWSFVIATRDDNLEFERLLSCLVEANQQWAVNASVLSLNCTKVKFAQNGKPNTAAEHDLGLAVGNLCVEATVRGLAVHQMKGIVPARARELLRLPPDVEPCTAMAIGYRASPDSMDESLRRRDTAPRQRNPLREFVFAGKWGDAATLKR